MVGGGFVGRVVVVGQEVEEVKELVQGPGEKLSFELNSNFKVNLMFGRT